MRHIILVGWMACFGCGGPEYSQQEKELTTEQSERKRQLLAERDILADPSVLVGRSETEEQELLDLANHIGIKGNSRWYGLSVPRHDRPADYDGPPDEGDGNLLIHTVDGVIAKADYIVAEY